MKTGDLLSVFWSEERLSENLFRVRLRPDSQPLAVRLYPFAVFEDPPEGLCEETIPAPQSSFDETEPFSYCQPLLILTTRCNLSCSYCYALQGTYGVSADDMSEGVISGSISFLERMIQTSFAPKTRAGERYELGVICFGGEPLLALERIRFTHSSLKQLCSRLSERWPGTFQPVLTINTNGYSISDEALKFLATEREDFQVVVSYDGWSHDRHRLTRGGGATAREVKENVARLARLGVDVSVTCCVLPEAVALPEQTIACLSDFFELGIPVNLSFIRGPLSGVASRAVYPALVQAQYSRETLDQFGAAVASAITLGAPIYSRRYRRRLLEGGYRYRCGAGLFEFAVLPDGSAFPCHNFIAPGYSLGSVLDPEFSIGPGVPLVDSLKERCVARLEPCRECVFQSTCMSSFDCPAHSLQDLGDLGQVDVRFCGFARQVQAAILVDFLEEQGGASTK